MVIRLCVSVAVRLPVTSMLLIISNPLDEKKRKIYNQNDKYDNSNESNKDKTQ